MKLIPAACARELQVRISSAGPDDTLDPDSLSPVEDRLGQIILMKRLPSSILAEIDETGTALWNTCSQAMALLVRKSENVRILSRGMSPCISPCATWNSKLNAATAKAVAFGLVEVAASNTSWGVL